MQGLWQTVTRDKVETGCRGDQDQDIGQGREKQGMRGRPSKEEHTRCMCMSIGNIAGIKATCLFTRLDSV